MDALLDRFCRYVRIDTTASEDAAAYPNCPGQTELGRQLQAELNGMNLRDVRHDEHGIVVGTIPGNAPGAPIIVSSAPALLLRSVSGAGSRAL